MKFLMFKESPIRGEMLSVLNMAHCAFLDVRKLTGYQRDHESKDNNPYGVCAITPDIGEGITVTVLRTFPTMAEAEGCLRQTMENLALLTVVDITGPGWDSIEQIREALGDDPR